VSDEARVKVWVLTHHDGDEHLPPWDAVVAIYSSEAAAKRDAEARAMTGEAEHDREQAPLKWEAPVRGSSFQTAEWGARSHTYGLHSEWVLP
jgi:hypothetical protein